MKRERRKQPPPRLVFGTPVLPYSTGPLPPPAPGPASDADVDVSDGSAHDHGGESTPDGGLWIGNGGLDLYH